MMGKEENNQKVNQKAILEDKSFQSKNADSYNNLSISSSWCH